MRKGLFFVLVFYMLCFVCPLFGATTKIYVSNKGDDKNSGTYLKPLSSLNEAVKRAIVLIDASRANSIVISVGEGVFQIAEAIEFRPCENDNASITIKGKGAGKTVLSGGIELPPFEEDKKTGLWYVYLDLELVNNLHFSQLFVNDKRATLARIPNADSYYIPKNAEETRDSENSQDYKQKIYLAAEVKDAMKKVYQPDNVNISLLHYWDFTKKRIISYNDVDNSVSIVGPSVKRWNYLRNNTQLFFENDISFLDEPGEYYYDSQDGKLYYYPRPYEIMQDARAIVPITECIFRFKGDNSNRVKNIEIKDLSISNTLYDFPQDGENPQQAVASKDASVMLDYSENIVFSNCEFSHLGLYGIWFREACVGCKIENNYIHDLGAGGVKIGEHKYMYNETPTLTKSIIVYNNIICEGGRILPPAVGVILFNASDCTISHNDIFDFYYTGISVGWSWGFDGSPSKRNIINYNHVHHLGWNGLSDMGGIYTLGLSEGTQITNNIIHDVYTFGPDGYGIYLDEGSSGVLVKDNIVYYCKSAGFAQHYGCNNTVVNNIIANNYSSQLSIGSKEHSKNSLLFTNNIVFSNEKNNIFANNQWGNNDNVKADNNLYWSDGSPDCFFGINQKEWIVKTRKDKHSVVKDPALSIDGSKEVRLKNVNVTNSVSFKTINTKMVGVQGKNNWKKKAILPIEREVKFMQYESNDD